MAETTANETLKIAVHGRDRTGKSVSYRLRTKELVPGVVYGPKMTKPITITLSPKEVRAIYLKAGKTGLVTLETMEGAAAELNGTKVLFKEIQTHPYKNLITHVDLHQLDLERKVRVTVPLNFIGKAKGLTEGGIMSIVSRSVQIKALPLEIPNHIDVDVTNLGVNESIHASDLSKAAEGTAKYEFIYENDFALVAIVPPEDEKAAAPEAVATDAAAAAAPGAPAAAGAAAGAKAPAAGAAAAAGAKAPAAKAPAKK